MKLHEHHSKEIFARHGIPIPRGSVASTPAEARSIAAQLGVPVVVKAQVLVGGRGKAGGIRPAATPEEAEKVARQILGMQIRGFTVKKVLVDEAVPIQRELYLGIVIDRAQDKAVMMASAEGGVDIEEVAKTHPEKIFRRAIDPFLGLRDYQARELAFNLGLDRHLAREFTAIARCLYRAFVDSDASLAEINPLAITGNGVGPGKRPLPPLLALDAKMVLDDNALFRHPDLVNMRTEEEETAAEREARHFGLNYVQMEGEIGCLVNGAGLAMATMDIIKLYGGSPANFLDIGGGAQADKVAAALRIILSDPNVKAVLLNVFGGITRCDEVAKGILAALKEVRTEVPMVVRLVGTNEEEGRRLLAEAQMVTAATLTEAAQKAVALAHGG